MGYSNSNHIEKFVKGKVIKKIKTIIDKQQFILIFEDGEQLKLTGWKPCYIVVTPEDNKGEVIQSTQIMQWEAD